MLRVLSKEIEKGDNGFYDLDAMRRRVDETADLAERWRQYFVNEALRLAHWGQLREEVLKGETKSFRRHQHGHRRGA